MNVWTSCNAEQSIHLIKCIRLCRYSSLEYLTLITVEFLEAASSIIHFCDTVLLYCRMYVCIVSHFTNYTFYTFNQKNKTSFKINNKNFL